MQIAQGVNFFLAHRDGAQLLYNFVVVVVVGNGLGILDLVVDDGGSVGHIVLRNFHTLNSMELSGGGLC